MYTAAEYRKEADYYLRLAQGTPPGTRRIRLMEIAQGCLHLADDVESLTPAERRSGQTDPSYLDIAGSDSCCSGNSRTSRPQRATRPDPSDF